MLRAIRRPSPESQLMPSSNGKLLLLLRSLLVFSVLAPALFFGLSAWISYRDLFTAAENRAQHMANLVEEHTLKVFETIQLVLQQTDEKLADLDEERIRTARPLWDDLKALQQSLDQVDSIFVTDREGRNILTTRDYPAPAIDFSDRDYFLVQKNANSRGLYVGQAYMAASARNRSSISAFRAVARAASSKASSGYPPSPITSKSSTPRSVTRTTIFPLRWCARTATCSCAIRRRKETFHRARSLSPTPSRTARAHRFRQSLRSTGWSA